MPRPWRLRVEEFPSYVEGRWYSGVPDEIEPTAGGMRVLIRLSDRLQEGRRHEVILPIPPLRPEGLAADFFRAAGIPVVAGGTVDPKAAVGVPLRVRFARTENGTDWVVVAFAPLLPAGASASSPVSHRAGETPSVTTPEVTSVGNTRHPRT